MLSLSVESVKRFVLLSAMLLVLKDAEIEALGEIVVSAEFEVVLSSAPHSCRSMKGAHLNDLIVL